MLYRKTVLFYIMMQIHIHVVSKMQILMYQHVVKGDSVAIGPKLLSMKNYVIEIMT